MGTKSALLVGSNYPDTGSELNGCLNDVKDMKEYLLTQGYQDDHICVLTDEGLLKPTKSNILLSLLELILTGSEELFFHYSGHGSYVRDVDGDEDDGRDECLVPCDFQESGLILDDEIRGILCSLGENQKMTCLIDACHSGSSMDLKYNLYERAGGKYLSMKDDLKHLPTRGQCIMFSGCTDYQTSADAYEEGKSQGAMTFCFLKCVPSFGNSITYDLLIKNIRTLLRNHGYSQVPNLSSGRMLNLNSKFSV